MRTLILDNEAVDALRDPNHPHHRVALAFYEANRAVRRRDRLRRTLVPTAVRAEAGWDRREPASAVINRLDIRDAVLDPVATDDAAGLVAELAVSVADAHIGATISTCAGEEITVLTSDPNDIRAVAATRPVNVQVL